VIKSPTAHRTSRASATQYTVAATEFATGRW
jgi:hypothetical protein